MRRMVGAEVAGRFSEASVARRVDELASAIAASCFVPHIFAAMPIRG